MIKTNENLANLFESHKQELLVQIARQIKEQKLNVGEQTDSELLEGLTPPVDALIASIRAGNSEQWRDWVVSVARYNFEGGQSLEWFQQVVKIYQVIYHQLIDREVSGPENERLRELYKQRLASITMVTNVTAISTKLETNLKSRKS